MFVYIVLSLLLSLHTVYGFGEGMIPDDNPLLFNPETGTVECWDKQCIGMVIDHGSFIKCSGFESCKDAQLLALDSILCSGFESCKLAKAVTTDNAKYVECSGSSSCAESTIYSHNIIATGRNALQSADILSEGKAEISVKALGHFAGKEGAILCIEGSVCNLECGIDGCYKLQFVCEPGAVCNVVNDAENECLWNEDINKQFKDSMNDEEEGTLSYCPIFVKDEADPLNLAKNLKINNKDDRNHIIAIILMISSFIIIIISFIIYYRNKSKSLSHRHENEYSVLINK